MTVATDYKRVKLTLVGNLKQLRNFSEKLHLKKFVQIIDITVQKIEIDSFSIAVCGEFKRGKSTFINAILGEEILPADVLPTTATLNRVTYGSKPFVKIIFKDNEERNITVNKLVSFVTKLTPECEAVAASVKEAVIYYPVNYCRNNVEIIDTPGLSDDENMTAVTLSVLEKADAAIMVTSALAPFGESEGHFLTQNLLTTDLNQIIFVVNQIDNFKRNQDIEKILNKVKQRIKGFIESWAEQNLDRNSSAYKLYVSKVGNINIFGISAYQALSAKINNDDVLLAESRFQEFELALQKIVSHERGKILLQTVVNKVINITTEIIENLNIQKNNLLDLHHKNQQNHYKISSFVLEFKDLKKKKILHINKISDDIKNQTNPLINKLESRLKQAVEQIIESTDTSFSNDINTLLQQFATQVNNGVQNTSQSIAKKIQDVIFRELSTASQQVSNLVEISSEVMCTVENKINQFDENITAQSNAGAVSNSLNQALNDFKQEQQQLGNLSNLFPSSSEIFLLKDEANGLYTIVGGVAGSLFGPVGAAVGAAVGAGLGNSQKAKNFKNNYKSKVSVEIEKQLRSHNSNQIVDDYIYTASQSLNKLKNRIEQEFSFWIEDTQNTLAKLQGKQQALFESEYNKINAMQTETQDILNHAWVLFEQLNKTMQVEKEDELAEKICLNCGYENADNCKFCIKCGNQLSK
jgi:non-ribosomal peptide synthetase component F